MLLMQDCAAKPSVEIAEIGCKCMLWTVLSCIVIDSAVGKLYSTDHVHGHTVFAAHRYHMIVYATANSKITCVLILC